MNKILSTVMMAAALTLTASPAVADEQTSQQRGIDARVLKVKLGGVINLRIKQGATPSLVLIGEKRDVARVSVAQSGDTLTIDTENRGWHVGGDDRHDLRAELTLPNLNELLSHGVGATDVQGFTGNEIRLTLDGAGAVNITSQYRNVIARLGGVGNMTLNAGDTDQIDLTLRGAGHIAVNGHSKLLRATLDGVGASMRASSKPTRSTSTSLAWAAPPCMARRATAAPRRAAWAAYHGNQWRVPMEPKAARGGLALALDGDIVLDRLDALDAARQLYRLGDVIG